MPVDPVRSPWLAAMLLLDSVSVAMTNAIAGAVGQAGASNQGVQILYRLQAATEIAQSDLVNGLDADRAQMSRLLATLERRGLVERRPNPANGRARLVQITRDGRAAVGRYETAMATSLREQTETILALLSLLGAEVQPSRPTSPRAVVEHMAVAGQRFTAGMAPNAAKHGFGGPENGRVLRVIAARGCVRPTDVAESLRVPLPRVSKATAVLEERGLITRSHPAATDRRQVLLALTQPGRIAILDTLEAFRRHHPVVIAPFVEALWVDPAPPALGEQAPARPQAPAAR